MAAPVPKTKADEVLAEISALNGNRSNIDPFTIARLKREARSSFAVDAVGAHIALGALASFEWNDAEIDHHHTAAIRLADNCFTRRNYATSLTNVQRVGESWLQMKRASELEPTDLEMLSTAINAAFLAGEFAEANSLAETFAARAPGKTHAKAARIKQILQIFASKGVPVGVAKQMVSVAYSVLRDRHIDTSSMQIRNYEAADDSTVMYHIVVDSRRKPEEDLEAALADRLFDEVEELNLSVFWVGYDFAEVVLQEEDEVYAN